jgi:hypothetical protein
VALAQHAGRVLPGARPSQRAGNQTAGNQTVGFWGEAMLRELDYIEDDRDALRWALGCVAASYKARAASYKTRLAARRGFTSAIGARNVLRHVAACGALMLVIGFGLLENAESQTEPSRPVMDETACDSRDADAAPGMGQSLPARTATVSRDSGRPARAPDPAPETSCTSLNAPVPVPPKYQTR